MNASSCWVEHVDQLMHRGLHADAEAYLEKLYREGVNEPGAKVEVLSRLTGLCYNRLRHNKANVFANELQSELGVSTNSRFRSLLFSYAVCIYYLIFSKTWCRPLSYLYRWLFPKPAIIPGWKTANALLYGNFWFNIHASASLAALLYSVSKSHEERLESIGLLAYSLSYSGHNLIGNRAIRKVTNEAERRGYQDVVSRLSTLLAIAFSISADADKALAVYVKMEGSKNLDSFYRLVIAANKILLSLADKCPADAQEAINLCFKESFTSSANHIQIYGGQAILFALANLPDEAKAMMERSLLRTEIAGGHLNFLFYYYTEALMWLILKNHAACRASLEKAYEQSKIYGGTKWHIQEMMRIDCVNRSLEKNSFWASKYYLLKFLLHSLGTLNVGLIKKGFKIFFTFLFNAQFNYWHERDVIGFFRHYFKGADASRTSHLGKVSLKIASAFIDSHQNFLALDQEGLERQIKRALPILDVVFDATKEAIVKQIREKYAMPDVIVVSDNSDRVRIKCLDQGFFICVSASTMSAGKSVDESLFAGILVREVDVQSEELIEAFLRVILSQYVVNRVLIREEKKRFDMQKEAATNQTIAKTVQMLAHDVRRPFSMIEGILSMLASPGDPEQRQVFAAKYLPDVKRAIADVTDMLSDVIEIGTTDRLEFSDLSPKFFMEEAIAEGLRYHPTAEIEFDYNFKHTFKIHVDQRKISRVMSNLVINALQAMNFSGRLWFCTVDVEHANKPFVHCTIGNSDSVISPEDQDKIFEAYFTKGKKSGTGLGLAIAQKVVREHGGRIWCVSNEQLGTEFHFLLPSSDVPDLELVKLHANSNALQQKYPAFSLRQDGSEAPVTKEVAIEGALVELLAELPRHLRVAIADDEPIYRNMLQEQLEAVPEIAKTVDVISVASGEDMLQLTATQHFDVIIVDVDFGSDSINGFEVVRLLRNKGLAATIVVHSNRGALKYQALSTDAGADLFVPKPLSRAVFYKILGSVAQTVSELPPGSVSQLL